MTKISVWKYRNLLKTGEEEQVWLIAGEICLSKRILIKPKLTGDVHTFEKQNA